ncbi:patatin-like phospholipase family protein [Paenibacillus motobuensis]|uniref:patatin-like phospholipase family protein n=1 Tax=Paenibacillus TaxID=44249 RepID=UPI00203B1967|nr:MULTISPECIES: patatin-like phospholipase family protein [Paenibacillus]MCM3042540.1 patatin-like phospholipase family protein [Paenibacillus lutimineralis]MCM3649644.1 patatin-like phospholipase family protein [Paenibacillus motobuensis]
MAVGLVLSGGGARGDFEVGAVRYLYELGIRPTVLTGSSVGAINAIKLAEGEGDGNDPNRGLRGLIQIWRGLNTNSDMWREEDWFRNVTNNTIVKLLSMAADDEAKVTKSEGDKLIGSKIGWLYVLKDLPNDISSLKTDIMKVINANSRSLYNLNPIREKLNDTTKLDLTKVRSSGIKLRLATVALESGALRYVTENGTMLERDGTSPVYSKSSSYASQCQPFADKIKLLKRELSGLQEELAGAASGREKSAIVAAIKSVNEQISEQSQQLNSCNLQYPPSRNISVVSLIDGTIASASIPMAFSPVKLADENYVDGGVREIAPIQSAIQAGASDVYVVLASDNSLDEARSVASGKVLPSFDTGVANMADVIYRSTSDIMADEIGYNETNPIGGWNANVTVIQPDYDIHDIMTIDPGLIDIRMAQGYMRADDTIQAKQQNPQDYLAVAEQLSRDRHTILIYKIREEIWKLEYAANGYILAYDNHDRPIHPAPVITPSYDAMLEVRNLKNKLRSYVLERQSKGGKVPSEVESWWSDWERHPWQPTRRLWLPTGPAATGDDMLPGEVLDYERSIDSPNGNYSFVFQGDGNLVLYKITRTITRLASQCQSIADAISNLKVELEGLQQELSEAGSAREKAAIVAQIKQVNAEINQKKSQLDSCNVTYPPIVSIQRSPIWATGTGGPAGVCILQHDGNLVIYDQGSQVRWASNTAQYPGSRLFVQDDGNVVIYKTDGVAVWAIK